MMAQRLEDDSIVLVGSAWHADCDPFLTVVVSRVLPNNGTMHQTIETIMNSAIHEEVQNVLDADCDESCEDDCAEHTPDIRESGAFEERLGDLDLTGFERTELARNGYLYLGR